MKKDIIKMAKEAGLNVGPAGMGQTVWGDDTNLERFAALVRADERKRIADIIRSDKYGIGNMCSQWTSDDVADDILEATYEPVDAMPLFDDWDKDWK